jgi:small subunit ribosomal protein S23e
MGKGKPAGLNAARKLRIHRRENRWADDHYRKRALGTAWKMSPLKGASHGKGIVLEKIGIEAKQPNSAVRKCVRVQLIKNGKKYNPHQNANWLLAGFEQVLIVG